LERESEVSEIFKFTEGCIAEFGALTFVLQKKKMLVEYDTQAGRQVPVWHRIILPSFSGLLFLGLRHLTCWE
jgi:hypothetical protein